MKIKKLKSRYKIIKPFKVEKIEDYRYVNIDNSTYRKERYYYYAIPKLDIQYTNSENWKEVKKELRSDIYHLYHVCCECPKKKLGKLPLKWRKVLKKHIKVMF